MSMRSLDRRIIERQAAQSYEQLAPDFYDRSIHPTTYVFGLAVEGYLQSEGLPMISGGCYLEVGAGRSRIAEFAPPGARLILSDISTRMLHHSKYVNTQAAISMVVASAFDLPIRDNGLDGVFALLGDAYGIEPFFKEALRVLKKGGFLEYIAPEARWGHTLRELLGVPLDVTPLMDQGGRTLLVPSVLTPDSNLAYLVRSIGFSRIEVRNLYVPKEVKEKDMPKHISIVANREGVSCYDVPILSVIRAYKAVL